MAENSRRSRRITPLLLVHLVLVASSRGGSPRRRRSTRSRFIAESWPAYQVAPMEFRRIPGLPPYVFTIIDGLKVEARRAGRDVIDLGFGNPDIPSPDIAVEKLAEAAHNTRNHRYSASRGHPEAARGRRRPLPAPLRRRARPRHRGHQHHRRQGGLQPPHVGAAPGRRRLPRAEPELPDPHLGPVLRRRRRPPGARRRRRGLHRQRDGGVGARLAQAPGHRAVVPAQPDDGVRRAGATSSASSTGPASATSCSSTTSPTPRRRSTAGCRRRSSSARAPRSAPSSCTR